ncbi:germ cell-specific gene 1-like protein isoform X3 [Salvelinus fontinalis]|uniref:germ cell-specific gene 1-like protein isoform X3 n=1 Tax=Salvelinus fontinalis TaxID=8038 RepID=UPI0024865C01|nr:germ cell-specific gene 1-like protein isoform X3 [Salvelinus fontinalis]
MGGIDRQRRVSLALTLNFLALILAVSALTTSYWCEGTRKVAKPFCTGPVTTKQSFCIRFNSSNINDSRLVQYIWESGEDKYIMRKFHTGIWFSCEENVNMTGEICRSFIYVTPSHERGLLGMVAHMMFTTAFQLTVSVGPEDWKPQTWDYSWSYILAWSSFTACMASSVTIINRYTKTILEFKHKRRNIEKNLKIKQKLLELDSGPGVGVGQVGHVEQVWDMYISSVPSSGCTAEELLDLSSNGRKLSNASVFLDLNDLPDPQREEYC